MQIHPLLSGLVSAAAKIDTKIAAAAAASSVQSEISNNPIINFIWTGKPEKDNKYLYDTAFDGAKELSQALHKNHQINYWCEQEHIEYFQEELINYPLTVKPLEEILDSYPEHKKRFIEIITVLKSQGYLNVCKELWSLFLIATGNDTGVYNLDTSMSLTEIMTIESLPRFTKAMYPRTLVLSDIDEKTTTETLPIYGDLFMYYSPERNSFFFYSVAKVAFNLLDIYCRFVEKEDFNFRDNFDESKPQCISRTESKLSNELIYFIENDEKHLNASVLTQFFSLLLNEIGYDLCPIEAKTMIYIKPKSIKTCIDYNSERFFGFFDSVVSTHETKKTDILVLTEGEISGRGLLGLTKNFRRSWLEDDEQCDKTSSHKIR